MTFQGMFEVYDTVAIEGLCKQNGWVVLVTEAPTVPCAFLVLALSRVGVVSIQSEVVPTADLLRGYTVLCSKNQGHLIWTQNYGIPHIRTPQFLEAPVWFTGAL